MDLPLSPALQWMALGVSFAWLFRAWFRHRTSPEYPRLCGMPHAEWRVWLRQRATTDDRAARAYLRMLEADVSDFEPVVKDFRTRAPSELGAAQSLPAMEADLLALKNERHWAQATVARQPSNQRLHLSGAASEAPADHGAPPSDKGT